MDTIKTVELLLVDDHPLTLVALRQILRTQNNFNIIGECNNGEEAVRLANELHPDVVIMDIGMPVMNGLEATRIIKAEHPEINILILTVYTDNEHVFDILQAGADGYLVKNASTVEITAAINSVAAGDSILSSEISKQVFRYIYQFNKKTQVRLDTGDHLNVREVELLRFLAQGLSNKDIANKISLSLYTIKSYLAELFLKLKASSRTEAVVVALQKGILTLDDIK
jgi:NarL family two-component system response regulator LiaR